MITQKELKKIFTYDEDTGFLHRKNGRYKGLVVGAIRPDGYVVAVIGTKTYLYHRLVWLYINGYEAEQIDHINRIKTDNRIDNLRSVTQQENQRNRPKSKNNTSGATGVRWEKRSKRWTARITVDRKEISLGGYPTFSEAVDARKNAEILYGFSENHGKDL